MDRIWLKNYPAGVAPEINQTEYASLNDVFLRSFRRYGSDPAFKNLGTTLTYDDLERHSRHFAAWLESLSLPKNTRVALMMPNLLQYPVALVGVLRAGMIVVNVNPLYRPRELEHQLKDSGAEVIVILENFAHVLQKVVANTPVKHVVITRVGDLIPAPRRWAVDLAVKYVKRMVPEWRIPHARRFRAVLRRGASAEFYEARPALDDIAFLQYTGGTTGASKGAILTHGNLVANLLQAREWTKLILEEGRETVITALPLYHVFSLTTNCLLGMKIGGVNILITNPRDLPGLVKELKKAQFTVLVGVNTLFNSLLKTPGFADIDFTKLKIAIGGGAAVHRAVAERWLAVTGHHLTEGYGLTEASPFVSSNLFRTAYTGTIGVPLPGTDIKLCDEHETEVPLGKEGEIWVRGPQVTQGYWRQSDETQRTITPDGWLRTGDIGVLDERGYLRITDRKKDMILVSGFNVYPNEVEGVIAEIPGVLECAVIGVPSEITGEAVKAFIVRQDPDLTAETVTAFCRERLTNYKSPKIVEFRSELPKNPIGKVLRRELRVAVAAQQQERAATAEVT